MIYLKATLVGLLYAVLSLIAIVALFVGPLIWEIYFGSQSIPGGVGAISFGFSELLFLVLPLIPLMLGFAWLFKRAQGSVQKTALIVGICALTLVSCIALVAWNVFTGIGASGSAGIGAVSLGLSEMLFQLVPSSAFVGGFLREFTRQDPDVRAGNLSLYVKATAAGVALTLAAFVASAFASQAAATNAIVWARDLAQRLSLPEEEAAGLLSVGIANTLNSLIDLLPLLAFAVAFFRTLKYAQRIAADTPGAEFSATQAVRYSRAALSGLLWVAGWTVLFAPIAIWNSYTFLQRSAGESTFDAQALGRQDLFVEMAGVWLPLFVFVLGVWRSLRRSGRESSTHSQ